MCQKILLHCDLGDFSIMKRMALLAKDFNSGFKKCHITYLLLSMDNHRARLMASQFLLFPAFPKEMLVLDSMDHVKEQQKQGVGIHCAFCGIAAESIRCYLNFSSMLETLLSIAP